jgi:type IV fimbrial biogenesis protein FimT
VLDREKGTDLLMNTAPANRGFTMIELLVTISVIALLVTLSIPSFRTWVNNQQTRAAAETIQNALRLAQSTSLHQSRSVTLCLTDATPSSSLVSAGNTNCVTSGKNWFVQMRSLFTGEAPAGADQSALYVRGGTLGNVSSNVTITLHGAAGTGLTFNSLGRLTGEAGSVYYTFENDYGDHALAVTVDVGGQVRMCDLSHTSLNLPDACPNYVTL